MDPGEHDHTGLTGGARPVPQMISGFPQDPRKDFFMQSGLFENVNAGIGRRRFHQPEAGLRVCPAQSRIGCKNFLSAVRH